MHRDDCVNCTQSHLGLLKPPDPNEHEDECDQEQTYRSDESTRHTDSVEQAKYSGASCNTCCENQKRTDKTPHVFCLSAVAVFLPGSSEEHLS